MSFHKIGELTKKTDRRGKEYLAGFVRVRGKAIQIQVWPRRWDRKEGADLWVYKQVTDPEFREETRERLDELARRREAAGLNRDMAAGAVRAAPASAGVDKKLSGRRRGGR